MSSFLPHKSKVQCLYYCIFVVTLVFCLPRWTIWASVWNGGYLQQVLCYVIGSPCPHNLTSLWTLLLFVRPRVFSIWSDHCELLLTPRHLQAVVRNCGCLHCVAEKCSTEQYRTVKRLGCDVDEGLDYTVNDMVKIVHDLW